jgi:hypothetical protein
MWRAARDVFLSALGDLRRSWKVLAITDLAYKAIAFALLMPATTLLLYWLRAGTSQRVVADTDIAMFFLTTPSGLVTLILGGSLLVAITAVEASCLMAVGVGQSQGVSLNGRGALRFGAANALNVLRLSGHMVLRVMLGVLPFALAAGVVYLVLLRAHDINYYLLTTPVLDRCVPGGASVSGSRSWAPSSLGVCPAAGGVRQVHPRQALGRCQARGRFLRAHSRIARHGGGRGVRRDEHADAVDAGYRVLGRPSVGFAPLLLLPWACGPWRPRCSRWQSTS